MGHSYKTKSFSKKLATSLIKNETLSYLEKSKIFNDTEFFETNYPQGLAIEVFRSFHFDLWIPVFTGMTISTETSTQSIEEFFSIKTKAQMLLDINGGKHLSLLKSMDTENNQTISYKNKLNQKL